MQTYKYITPLSTGLYEQTSNCAQSNYEQMSKCPRVGGNRSSKSQFKIAHVNKPLCFSAYRDTLSHHQEKIPSGYSVNQYFALKLYNIIFLYSPNPLFFSFDMYHNSIFFQLQLDCMSCTHVIAVMQLYFNKISHYLTWPPFCNSQRHWLHTC